MSYSFSVFTLVAASRFIILGEIRDVGKDIAFDFRKVKEMGNDIGSLDGGGYDHCFCFDNESDFRARFVGCLLLTTVITNH